METTASHDYAIDQEHKLDFMQADTSIIQHRSSKGVHRALFPTDGPTRSLSEQDVDLIIRDAVKELATEGKRVALAPKRM